MTILWLWFDSHWCYKLNLDCYLTGKKVHLYTQLLQFLHYIFFKI